MVLVLRVRCQVEAAGKGRQAEDLPKVPDTYQICTSSVCMFCSTARELEKIVTHLQIRARMSPLPVAKTPPVGLGATEMTMDG